MKDTNHLSALQELYRHAVDLHSRGNAAEAAPIYMDIVTELPDADQVVYNLGLAQYELSAFSEAAATFRRATRLNPDDPDYWFNLGLACKKCQLYAEAESAYLAALKLRPDDVDIYYNLACAYKDEGREDEAIRYYEKALLIQGGYTAAINNLAYLYHRQGKYEQAGLLYEQLLKFKPDHTAARHMLAALRGAGENAPPVEYVQELFDQYSESFETHLIEELEYRVPQLLWTLFLQHCGDKTFSCALDLGCGTGLAGELFRPACRELVGLDLSSKMVALATEKNVYDRLAVNDAIAFLETATEVFDLVLAADVLSYLGALEPLFTAVVERVPTGGIFSFSVEKHNSSSDWQLQRTGRYAHSPDYIERVAAETGWVVNGSQEERLRLEQGQWLEGMVYLLTKA